MVELSGQDQERLRAYLNDAFTAARTFDGSAGSESAMVSPLILFDEFARAKNDGVPSAEVEQDIVHTVFPDEEYPENMPDTVGGFLDVASQFYERLKNAGTSAELFRTLEASGAVVQESDCVFVKTDDGNMAGAESEAPHTYELKTEPRLATLIQHLRDQGVNGQPVFMDDLVVTTGIVDDSMMRQHPYTIVQIPRLDMEIAVCDQVEETTFVKKGNVDAVFWDHLSKDDLKAREDVWNIDRHNDSQWWSDIEEVLSGNAEPVVRRRDWKPKLDIELVKASLLAHRLETGKWLKAGDKQAGQKKASYTLEHGPYAGHGIQARTLDTYLQKGRRGLPEGLSVAGVNEELAREHGLEFKNVQKQPKLTIEGVKASLLAFRQETGRWLASNEPGPDGKQGSYVLMHPHYGDKGIKVHNLLSNLQNGQRGLPEGSSIAALNEEVSGEHGLDYVNRKEQDNIDIADVKAALLAYRLETGKWLTDSLRGADGKGHLIQCGSVSVRVTSLQRFLDGGWRGLPGDSSIAALNEEISAEHGLDYVNHLQHGDLDLDLVRTALLRHGLLGGQLPSASEKKVRGPARGSEILTYDLEGKRQFKVKTLDTYLRDGDCGLQDGSSVAEELDDVACIFGAQGDTRHARKKELGEALQGFRTELLGDFGDDTDAFVEYAHALTYGDFERELTSRIDRGQDPKPELVPS